MASERAACGKALRHREQEKFLGLAGDPTCLGKIGGGFPSATEGLARVLSTLRAAPRRDPSEPGPGRVDDSRLPGHTVCAYMWPSEW